MKAKIAAAAILTIASLSAFAQAPASPLGQAKGKPGVSFEEAKSRAVSHINERKASLDKNLSCVQSATDMAGLKACHETAKSERAATRERHHAEKASRMASKGAGAPAGASK